MQGIIIDLKYYPFYIKRHFLFCELRRNCIPAILPYVLRSHYLNVIAFVPFNYDIRSIANHVNETSERKKMIMIAQN